ncbi:hypothetical protein SAMN04487950_4068 [Halogranum rubrum]|uniref:Uncharacterized protein n=1 Tax=Halogranum rubrum TaxID=553466 RepID=A0A1I4I9F9_9EURY|nr:hypothetical protein [Halogranum rubrum]SFL51038.1 hypothetical protein SAMN04487950_4068 [Halogranum rubrum]
MTPLSDTLDSLTSVSAADLVGGLLVLWVLTLGSVLTSSVDPATPPTWWGVAGLLLTLASVTVAAVLSRQLTDAGTRMETVWEVTSEQGVEGVEHAASDPHVDADDAWSRESAQTRRDESDTHSRHNR